MRYWLIALLIGGCFVCGFILVWGLVIAPSIERAEQQENARISAEIQRKAEQEELDKYLADREAERARLVVEAEKREQERVTELEASNERGRRLFATHTIIGECLHDIAKHPDQPPTDIAGRYTDPWGRAIRYREVPGGWLNAGYSLVESAGPDEIFDTVDDISDRYDETLYHE